MKTVCPCLDRLPIEHLRVLVGTFALTYGRQPRSVGVGMDLYFALAAAGENGHPAVTDDEPDGLTVDGVPIGVTMDAAYLPTCCMSESGGGFNDPFSDDYDPTRNNEI